jgi:type II secretory pathway component PulM
MESLGVLAEIVGPIGVLVVVVAWALISRRQNGRADRYEVVLTKLDAFREDIGEVKSDVRDLRSGLVHHLEDHANT